MTAADQYVPQTGTGMTKILGDCEQLGRVTGEGTGNAQHRLESALGPELAGRLVGALARGRRGRALA